MPDDASPQGKRRAGPGRGKKEPVGRGAGWGGPAKGAATRESLTLVEPDNTLGLNGRKGAVDENGVPVRRRLDKQEQLETIKDVWWREMHTSPDTGYRIVAGDKLYDRLDGKAPQQVVNKDVTPTELAIERSESARAIVARRRAAAQSTDPAA